MAKSRLKAKYQGSFSDKSSHVTLDRETGELYVGGELSWSFPYSVEVYAGEPLVWVPPSNLASALESGDELEFKKTLHEIRKAWIDDEDLWDEEHAEEGEGDDEGDEDEENEVEDEAEEDEGEDSDSDEAEDGAEDEEDNADGDDE